MANKRIYDLTEDTAPASGDYIATDKSGEGAASKVNLSKLLLASGTIAGATSQAQTFTNGIIGPSWKPASDSTTALRFQKAAGTAVVTIDTTNSRLGIGVTPEERLHVAGHVLINNNNRLYWYMADGVSRLTALQLDSSDDLNMVIKHNRSLIIKDTSANAMLKLTDVGTTGNLMVTGMVFAGGTTTPTAFLDAAASTTSAASVRIRSGTAPSAPNAGDLWFDGTNLKFYDGTTTRTLSWT